MQCFLVGGAVRDKLLNYPVKEHDWVVVGATPEEMMAAGFRPVGKDFPVFLHPDSGEEYALARTERKSGHGYHGFVCHSSPDVTLEDDLGRRDLTINAMAEASDGTLVDPYGGRDDLERRLLRHVSPAFGEDPLRILRVARFAARYHHLGFRVADETLALMRTMTASGEVNHLVPERVWKETERALGEREPAQYFATLRAAGALGPLFPEFAQVSNDGWANLGRAAANGCDTVQRFAVLTAELAPASIDALCRRLKLPNSYRELASLVAELLMEARGATDAISCFALLNRTDALRRPDRFASFVAAGIVLGLERQQARRLNEALSAAQAVKAAALGNTGLRGKELGDAIDRARLAAIAQRLEAIAK